MEQIRVKSRLRGNIGDILGSGVAVGIMHRINPKGLYDDLMVKLAGLSNLPLVPDNIADSSPLHVGRLSYALLAASGFYRGENRDISSALGYAGVAGVAYSTLQSQNTNSLDDLMYAATTALVAYVGGAATDKIANRSYDVGKGLVDYFKRRFRYS